MKLAELTQVLAHDASLRSHRIAVGFSGGLDSTVLLHLLANSLPKQNLTAIHVHHGLQSAADAWPNHCRQICSALDIPLDIHSVSVAKNSGQGLEAAAREARYAAFAQCECDLLALAHHADDQAETILHRLIRGSGVHGISAMQTTRTFATDKLLWRPLLNIPRSELEDYAQRHNLSWIDDASNEDHRFERNYLRHHILPTLKTRHPHTIQALGRAAALFSEASSLLNVLAELDAGPAKPFLNLARLDNLDPARQRNVLHWFLTNAQLKPTWDQICELQRQLTETEHDNKLAIHIGTSAVRRYRQQLFITPAKLPPNPTHTQPGSTNLPSDWPGLFQWKSKLGGLPIALANQLIIRPKAAGASLSIDKNRPNRPIKLLFQEHGIPHWQRNYWPTLWLDGELIGIANIGIKPAYQVEADQLGLYPHWQPNW